MTKPTVDDLNEVKELDAEQQRAVRGGIQFQIQMGTSDLQNAENVRSQAEKSRDVLGNMVSGYSTQPEDRAKYDQSLNGIAQNLKA